jgi:polyhydroxybutyrate depolymerase
MINEIKSVFIAGWSVFLKTVAELNIQSLPGKPGRDVRKYMIHKNLRRTFKVHIPPSTGDKAKLPLMLALHGRGATGESMILITKKGFNELADSEGFIVVYPDAVELNWNDGRSDEEAKDRAHRENIDDVGFISALMDLMINDYNADPGRVYITGISNGAIMAYRVACELSAKIAAIAPVDGNMPYMLIKKCHQTSPVSVLAINNVNDPVVPFEGGVIYSHFRKKLGKVLSTEDSLTFWVKRNNCLPDPDVNELDDRDPSDGTRVYVKHYTGGSEDTEVILYAVEGGGHTWPGGFQYLPVRIIGRTSREINANEIIWFFFKKHSKQAVCNT